MLWVQCPKFGAICKLSALIPKQLSGCKFKREGKEGIENELEIKIIRSKTDIKKID